MWWPGNRVDVPGTERQAQCQDRSKHAEDIFNAKGLAVSPGSLTRFKIDLRIGIAPVHQPDDGFGHEGMAVGPDGNFAEQFHGNKIGAVEITHF